MAINYLRRVQARYQGQGQSDVSRGIAAGEAVGKLLGNLGTAIRGAQKDALANKLMNTVDAPRAALVNSGGPQPSQSQGVDSGDPDADLSTDLPQDVSQSIGGSAPILNQAVAAQRLSDPGTVDPNADLSTDLPENVSSTQSVQVQASPSGAGINMDTPASTAYSGTATDPTIASNVAAARLSSLQPTARPLLAPGVSTAGTRPHTGGVQELDLMKEMQAMQQAKATAALAAQKNALDMADRQAEASGTGRYAMDAAIKRAQLAAAQNRALHPAGNKPVDLEKNPPPATNLDSEPVLNQTQLVKHYGKNVVEDMTDALSIPPTIKDAQGNDIPNPEAPATVGDSLQYGPAKKDGTGRNNIPLSDAAILTKQLNSIRKKAGQPLLRVPGETDLNLGRTPDNPYPIQSKLDMFSRAKGTWVRLPSGQIAQVP